MARPLRIEFAAALYHVTSRGNARQAIYISNDDRQKFLIFCPKRLITMIGTVMLIA